MKHPVLDTVSAEQHALKKPWALMIVLAILILFGTFWMYAKQDVPKPAATNNKQLSLNEVTTLQTALADATVPDFSDLF